jgi:hypothetical protein
MNFLIIIVTNDKFWNFELGLAQHFVTILLTIWQVSILLVRSY